MIDSTPTQHLPPNRDALLSMVGVHKENIYQMVRQILDDMEAAAPWEGLYYPPNDTQAFLAMESDFLDVIDRIPARLQKLTESFLLEGMDPEAEQVLGDAEFFFGAIHDSVSPDIQKLRSKLRALSATSGAIALTTAERAFTCEISADLKGKYTSSIMGAAATLIASGLWNGVEIEPILFPEKREEFQRNELLVETLQEVVSNISNLLEELPLAHLVKVWESGQRVDQYALTTLYSFLGNLGKLMKGKCRRALYSGDYHQIQKRESLLSSRINELTTLHHVTWGTVPEEAVGGSASVYPRMILKATELAAILDLDILRKIIGNELVQEILSIVTVEKEKQKADNRDNPYAAVEPKPSPLRDKLPPQLVSLVPLLYDEDLQKFLTLLLGSVRKRASLEVSRQRERAGEDPLVPSIDPNEDSAQVPTMDSNVGEESVGEESAVEELDMSFLDEPDFASQVQVDEPSEVILPSPQADFAPHAETSSDVGTADLPSPDEALSSMSDGVFEDSGPTFAVPEQAAAPEPTAVPELKFSGSDSSFQISFDTTEPTPSSPPVQPPPTMAPDPTPSFEEAAVEFSQTSANPFASDDPDDALDAALPSFGESSEVTPPVDFEPRFDVGQPVVPEPSGIIDRPTVETPSARDRPPTFTEPSATYDRPTFGPKDSPFEPKLSMDEVLSPLPDFGFPDLPDPVLPQAEAPKLTADPAALEQLQTLKDLDGILSELLSRQNSHRKKFDMVHQFLQRRKTMPPSMLESMHPYLYDVLNMLVPQLHNLKDTPDIPPERATELIEICTFLCNKNMSPMQVKNDVLPTLGKLLSMLESLSRDTKGLKDRLTSDTMAF